MTDLVALSGASTPAPILDGTGGRDPFTKGNVSVAGRKSEFSLYSKHLATYEKGDQFDHEAAKGFIRLWGLSQQTQAQRQLLTGEKGFDLPGVLTR